MINGRAHSPTHQKSCQDWTLILQTGGYYNELHSCTRDYPLCNRMDPSTTYWTLVLKTGHYYNRLDPSTTDWQLLLDPSTTDWTLVQLIGPKYYGLVVTTRD